MSDLWSDTAKSDPLSDISAYLSLDWLQQQLARFSYKPGYTMQIAPEPTSFLRGFLLRVEMEVRDSREVADSSVHWSRRPTEPRMVKIGFSVRAPHHVAEMKDEAYFARWLADALLDLERHELREWLRRDGEIFDDPHAEGARR